MHADQKDPRELLLEQLRQSFGLSAHLKRSARQFVLDYGWWYDSGPPLGNVAAGIPQECFNNAVNLVTANPTFIYCEGFGIGHAGLLVHHAWVTDGSGRAIDTTWGPRGLAYAGVPFKSEFVMMRALARRAVVCLLDDWMYGWPLLREEGDRPDDWLEQRGAGVVRVTGSDCN